MRVVKRENSIQSDDYLLWRVADGETVYSLRTLGGYLNSGGERCDISNRIGKKKKPNYKHIRTELIEIRRISYLSIKRRQTHRHKRELYRVLSAIGGGISKFGSNVSVYGWTGKKISSFSDAWLWCRVSLLLCSNVQSDLRYLSTCAPPRFNTICPAHASLIKRHLSVWRNSPENDWKLDTHHWKPQLYRPVIYCSQLAVSV